MRSPFTPQISLILLLLTAGCMGGEMPIDAKKVLNDLDGPKVPTMQDTQVESAKAFEAKGDYKQASTLYQSLAEQKPDNLDLRLMLADSQRRSGDYARSIITYDSILAVDANNLSAKEGKGLALLSKGDFETPTSLFEEVLKADPKRWKTLNALGILFVTRGLNHEAQQYFQEASKQNPSSASVMNNLGLTQALDKKFNSAIETLKQASALTTTDGVDRTRIDLNLALVYAISGDLVNAQKMAELHLSGAVLSNNLGLYAHLAKDDSLARDYLNMALTDSKTYYGKAWDNLDALNGSSGDSKKSSGGNAAKPAPQSTDQPKTPQPLQTIEIQPEPTATSSTVKSLGKIQTNNLN